MSRILKKPVLSTFKILMEKSFNSDIDETWINWAMEMMEVGFENENLFILAGISKPYNQFELQDLTTKILTELNLEFTNQNLVIKNYVYYLISNSIYKTETYLETLLELKNICIELNLEHNYMNFYLLYFAKDDLVEQEYQHYWNDANRENIDEIITENYKNWKTEYETELN